MNHRRNSEAAERSAERRRRENDARRLLEDVPDLESLRLEIEEHRSGNPLAGSAYIRRVVVESAPSLFVISCGDRSCKNGGHDLTRAVMRDLQERSTRFEGEDTCQGTLGTAECARVLRFVAIATFK